MSPVQIDLIQEIPCFMGLSAKERDWLSRACGDHRIEKGSAVLEKYQEKDPAGNLVRDWAFFVVYAGYVKVVERTNDVESRMVGILGRGDTIRLSDYPGFEFIALGRCRIFSLDSIGFSILEKLVPAQFLSGENYERTPTAAVRLTAEERLLKFLELNSKRFGRLEGAQVWLPFALSRKDLAKALEIRPETAIRLARKLEKEGLLRCEKTQTWISLNIWKDRASH